MPYNFICIQTGCILSQLTSIDDVFTIWTLLKLMLFANIALIPGVLLKNYHQRKEMERKRDELSDKIRQKEEELLALEEEEEELRKLQEMAADMQRRQGGPVLTELQEEDIDTGNNVTNSETKKQL